MSAFEDFVTLELPKRPTMLTTANTGYDNNPNLGGAPAVISGSPTGTFYLRATGNVLYKKNSSSAGTWEVVGAGGGGPAAFSKIFAVATPAISDLVSVHAALAGTAANMFPGPISNPDKPRNLQVFMATGWDGGDITVTGTDQFDISTSEIFTTGSNVIRVGSKVFKTVTDISKTTVGASAATASVGIGDTFGVSGVFVDTTSYMLTAGNAAEPAVLSMTYNSFTPTTLPDGVVSYLLIVNVSA